MFYRGQNNWSLIKNYIQKKFKTQYIEKDGKNHRLSFNSELILERHSISRDLGNYLLDLQKSAKLESDKLLVGECLEIHKDIIKLIGVTKRKVDNVDGTKSTKVVDIQDANGQFILTDKYFGQKSGEKLRQYLQNIAKILRIVPTSDEPTRTNIIPKTIIYYNPGDSADGVRATAPLISLDSDRSGSSPAGKDSELTSKIRKVKNINSRKVIRGHLINHELFGTGKGTANLAPITSKANGEMLNDFEEQAKNYVHTGKVIYLKVEYKYGKPNGQNKDDIIKDGIMQLPSQVNYTLKKLEYSRNSDMSQEAINNHKNWTGSGAMKSIAISHDDFF